MVRFYDFDVDKMVEEAARICRLYSEHKNVHIASENGTDIKFRIADGGVMKDDGMVTKKGDWHFLPGGNPSATVAAGSAEGKIVFDGTFGDMPNGVMPPVIPTSGIELTVRKGVITEIKGGTEANEFSKRARELADPNIFNCPAEFGVGLLSSAWTTEIMNIAERIRGAVHIGIGSNLSLPAGTIAAKGHLDGMILKPTLRLDDLTIVQNGKITINR